MARLDRLRLQPPTTQATSQNHIRLLVALVDFLLDSLPENREQETLHTVGNDTGAQTTTKETDPTVLGNDGTDSSRVRNGDIVGLAVSLDDTDGVGDGVGDGRRDETDEGVTGELLVEFGVAGERFLEVVL